MYVHTYAHHVSKHQIALWKAFQLAPLSKQVIGYIIYSYRSHLRDIRDRSVLRLFESADVSGGAFPGALGGAVGMAVSGPPGSGPPSWDQVRHSLIFIFIFHYRAKFALLHYYIIILYIHSHTYILRAQSSNRLMNCLDALPLGRRLHFLILASISVLILDLKNSHLKYVIELNLIEFYFILILGPKLLQRARVRFGVSSSAHTQDQGRILKTHIFVFINYFIAVYRINNNIFKSCNN